MGIKELEKEIQKLRSRVERLEKLKELDKTEEEKDENEMTKDEAVAYLKRKGKPVSKEEVETVMKCGRIYGDPLVELK